MTWEKLCEKAKEMGYLVDDCCIRTNDNTVYNHTMYYWKDGVITTEHFSNQCFVADHRTPSQMYQIMEALK